MDILRYLTESKNGSIQQKVFRAYLAPGRGIVDICANKLPIVGSGKKKKRQLLIVRLDSIGDFILFLDSFKEYRKLYPPEEWQITLLGNQLYKDLAEALPYPDFYWFVDCKRFRNNLSYRYRLLRLVRNARFDMVIQPTFSRHLSGDSIVRISGACERIGSVGDSSNISPRQKNRSDRWYTHLVSAVPERLMELDRSAEFIRGLGLRDFQSSVPKLSIPDKVQQQADRMLRELGICSSEDYDFYILFPGAGLIIKQWPIERFGRLAKTIYKQHGWMGLVCGGPGEEELAEDLIKQDRHVPLVNLAGRTRLMELGAVIKRARVLIGNDTGAIHIAAAVGTPSICILGGGHFGRFMPYSVPNNIHSVYTEMGCFNCNWRCIHRVEKGHPVPCIANIEVDQVIECLSDFLG